MPNRRGFIGRGVKPPQRQIANAGLVGTSTMTFAGNVEGSSAGSVGSVVLVPALTLVRTRGIVHVAIVTSGSTANPIVGVFGIIPVSLEAFTIGGLTSLPIPISDPERAWVVYQPWSVFADATTPGEAAPGANLNFMVDSRGMRKMKLDDTLAIVFEARQFAATTGTVVRFNYMLRFQDKL